MTYEKFLENKIKPFECQKKIITTFVLHPYHIGAFVIVLFLQAAGMIVSEVGELVYWYNFAWTATLGCIYISICCLLAPYLLRFCALNRVPFIWLLIIQYSVFLIIYLALFGAYVSHATHVPTYLPAFYNIIISLPFMVALAGIFGRRVALLVFDDPALYPTWKRFTFNDSINDNINESKIEEDHHKEFGSIRFVKAQSPETVVFTSTSSNVVKKPFKKIVESLPKDLGWRVHRSYWVAKSECKNITHVSGNPHLVLHGGEVIPISRSCVKDIKSYFAMLEINNPQSFMSTS